MVHALIGEGLNPGAAMTLLLVGPVTSYGTVFVLYKEFGKRTLLLYILVVCLLSLVFGKIFPFCSIKKYNRSF
jgi:hypothetical protein